MTELIVLFFGPKSVTTFGRTPAVNQPFMARKSTSEQLEHRHGTHSRQ
jgi:hypothetical protein